MDNLTRLSQQLADELQDSLQRGGIFAKDGEAAREAAIGSIVARVASLGNALVEVASMFGIHLTPKGRLEDGAYPLEFSDSVLHTVHEQAQFIITDVFRQGFPKQLWSDSMVRILTTHIASALATLQNEKRGLEEDKVALEMQVAELRARLNGYIDAAKPTQHPPALVQLVKAGSEPPPIPALLPAPKDTLVTDFFVIERAAGNTYAYYKLKGDGGCWVARPRDAMRFTSQEEAQRFLSVRVKPKQPKGLQEAFAVYTTPHWSDIAEYYP